MTFAQIKADTFRRLNYLASPDSSVSTRIAAFINETHEELLSMPQLKTCLFKTMPFTSVASLARYGLSNVAQIIAMKDATNDITLRVRSLGWYEANFPDPSTATGTPEYIVPIGVIAVSRRPSTDAGSGLWVASSSVTDTAGPTVTIDAIRADGYPHSPTAVALTGTTRVQIGTLTDYVDVAQFQLSAACVGDISLYDAASSGNVIAVVPRGQTTSRYWGFRLAPTPTTAVTYAVDFECELFTLTADTDEPLLPVRFHRLLAMGARMKEYEKIADARYGVAKAQYDEGVRNLVYAVMCPPGLTIVPGGGGNYEGSNLGAWFPAGRW